MFNFIKKEYIPSIIYLIVCIALIALKYFYIINWSWWIVILPSVPVVMLIVTLITLEIIFL